MEDGWMGEFAKSKINEIINFHNVIKKLKHVKCLQKIYEKRQDKFWQIQSIIGEDYLKQVVKNHLEDIEVILYPDTTQKKRIKRLEEELKRLKND